jgi:hypothetical protein
MFVLLLRGGWRDSVMLHPPIIYFFFFFISQSVGLGLNPSGSQIDFVDDSLECGEARCFSELSSLWGFLGFA